MKREFNVVIEMDSEGYYVATVPELRACRTQAKSLDTLMKRIREAIALCLEVEGAPEKSTHFIGLQRITLNSQKKIWQDTSNNPPQKNHSVLTPI